MRNFVIEILTEAKGAAAVKNLKSIVCCALCLAITAALCACSTQNDIAKKSTQIPNPVHGSSAEEFKAAGINMPELEGKTPVYTTIDCDKTLYQADYGDFVIRAQETDRQEDISGMSHDWQEEPIMTLELLQGDPVVKLDGNGAGIIYWYLGGRSWSVGMTQGADADTLRSLYFRTADLNP